MPSEWLVFFNGARWGDVGGWGLFIGLLMLLAYIVVRAKWYPEKMVQQMRTDHTAALEKMSKDHERSLKALEAAHDREAAGLRDGLTVALAANQELFSQQSKLLTGFSLVGHAMEAISPSPSPKGQEVVPRGE